VKPFVVAPSRVDDPFHFFAHLRTIARGRAILESLGPFDASTARYSVVGALPVQELRHEGSRAWLVDDGDRRRVEVDWLRVLDDWCPVGPLGAPDPVQTGAIGYVGYDANPARETRTSRHVNEPSVPAVRLVRYGAVLVFDRATARATWAYEPALEDEVAALERRWDAWRDREPPAAPFRVHGDLRPDISLDELMERVARTVEYIRAGDIFQANITARFSAGYDGDLFGAYAGMRETTPNPFFAYLDFDPPLLSTSPERFFQVAGGHAHSRPIKGTAPIEVDGVDQRAPLLARPKDRAENVMIVDVVRNDLGRVCRRGSVQVDSLCEAKRFNHLYHLESTVSGELEDGVSASRILGALFPPASITGAPKLRAIEVIDELEPVRRGPYCGAIGFFGSDGWIDTSVAIRVVYASAGRIYAHAGGGIVVDSLPETERGELLLKLEALRRPLDAFNVLAEPRAAIDAVDDRLLALLAERFAIVSEIAELKRKHGIPTLQPSRVEAMKTARERQAAELGTIPSGLVGELFDLLVRYAMIVEADAWEDAREGRARARSGHVGARLSGRGVP
jgi:para-aminobenzoate synthetase component 1